MLKTNFTTKERNKVYELALAGYKMLVKNNKQFGICYSILRALENLFPDECSVPMFNGTDLPLFPEINKHEPDEYETMYWFPVNTEDGIAKRIAIFEQAIEETSETVVVFRKVKSGDFKNIVYALFPYVEHNVLLCMSYEHVGQHSGADYERCIKASVSASPEEYADLMAELKSIGYNLRVQKRK